MRLSAKLLSTPKYLSPLASKNPQNTWRFATHWRDSTTTLGYANNRYYSNAYGRFMTPDPYQGNSGGAGDPTSPQSWNRYAYVQGDPINFLDPRGTTTCDANGDNCYDSVTVDGGSSNDSSAPPGNGALFLMYYKGLTSIEAPGGPGSANYLDALRAAKQAQSLESQLKDSVPCDKDLAKLGMTWQGLQSAVASESFQDGTESTATMVSLFAGSTAANQQLALATYGNQTIQNYLANKGSTAAAVSSAGGNLVFLNFNQFGGQLPLDNEATIMHEALHNATGFTDGQLQDKLGLSQGSSQNITNLMSKDCVF
jgi:RHS repeat-associated protein